MNSSERTTKIIQFADVFNKNPAISKLFVDSLTLQHRKKLQSARNKRYYLSHRDQILKKNKLKSTIYANFVKNSRI